MASQLSFLLGYCNEPKCYVHEQALEVREGARVCAFVVLSQLCVMDTSCHVRDGEKM